MIASLNSDCSILTLTSEALLISGVKLFTSLVLKTKRNCSTTQTSVVVSSLIGSISNNQILIPATLFYNDATKTKYCDDVYNFELEIAYDITSPLPVIPVSVTDSACIIIDCVLKCSVVKYFTTTKDKTAMYQYYALLQGNDCDSCTCIEMCSLYTELKKLLNDNNITSSTSGCGCS